MSLNASPFTLSISYSNLSFKASCLISSGFTGLLQACSPGHLLPLGFLFPHREESKWRTGGRKEGRLVFRMISPGIVERTPSMERQKERVSEDTRAGTRYECPWEF